MNYEESKKFQEYITNKSFSIIEEISSIMNEENFLLAWDYVDTSNDFKAILEKVRPKYFDDIKITNMNTLLPLVIDNTLSTFLSNIMIKSLSLVIPYNGVSFGIEVKTNKLVSDLNGSYKYDTKISILGTVDSYGKYDDDFYDIRYHPTVLSMNPFNIYFIDDEEGLVSTLEYNKIHDFDFPSNYNEWTETEYIQQRLSL